MSADDLDDLRAAEEKRRAREWRTMRKATIASNIERIAVRNATLHAIDQALKSTQGALKTATHNGDSDETITALASAMDQLEAAWNTAQQ